MIGIKITNNSGLVLNGEMVKSYPDKTLNKLNKKCHTDSNQTVKLKDHSGIILVVLSIIYIFKHNIGLTKLTAGISKLVDIT